MTYVHVPSEETIDSLLVGESVGVGCSSNSNSRIASVQDGIESLEPSQAEYEVKSRSFIAAKVTNNQVNVTGNTANVRVKATRPDLSVGSKRE